METKARRNQEAGVRPKTMTSRRIVTRMLILRVTMGMTPMAQERGTRRRRIKKAKKPQAVTMMR
jgi:hypothetical protein